MQREYVQEGMRKYLKLSGSGDETIGDKMFSYQNIPGFLPVDITWVNGQKQYIYDISGKIPLERYLSDVSVDVEQIKYILMQILDLPEKLGDYLLDRDGAVIEEKDLYVDPRTREIYAVYNDEKPHHGMTSIARLLEFIMGKMNQHDQDLVFFVYGLHRLAKEEGATCQNLKMYMEEYQGKEREPDHPLPESSSRKLPASERRAKGIRRETGKRIQLEQYILPGIFLLAGTMIPVVLWFCGWFALPVSGATDWTMASGATSFFLGVAGYGAWKTWPPKEETDVRLEREKRKSVCLIPCQGSEEPVPVSHFPFVIGYEKERVDGVLGARGISAVHAQILQEGEAVYIMDEESDSGTFYNDERLVPWQKTRLWDGDLLRFGQGEYVVEIT